MAETDDDANPTPLGVHAADVRTALGNANPAADETDDDEPADPPQGDDSKPSEDKDPDPEKGDDDDPEGGDPKKDPEAADDKDDPEKGDPDNPKSGVRFSQFAGDGKPETYLSNLEDGYYNSSKEAIRLNDENKVYKAQVDAVQQAADKDPEFAKTLLKLLEDNGGTPGKGNNQPNNGDAPANNRQQNDQDPFLLNARTEWNRKSEEEAEEFAKANPEVMTDPKINADVKHWIKIFSDDALKNEQRLMGAGEAMKKAYQHLGLDNKLEGQQLSAAAKKNAAPTRPAAPRKPKSKDTKEFSDLTLKFAEKTGVSKEMLEKANSK